MREVFPFLNIPGNSTMKGRDRAIRGPAPEAPPGSLPKPRCRKLALLSRVANPSAAEEQRDSPDNECNPGDVARTWLLREQPTRHEPCNQDLDQA